MSKQDAAGSMEGLISRRDVTTYLGISEASLRRIIQRGDLPVVVVGARRVLFDPDDLRAYVAKRRTQPPRTPDNDLEHEESDAPEQVRAPANLELRHD